MMPDQIAVNAWVGLLTPIAMAILIVFQIIQTKLSVARSEKIDKIEATTEKIHTLTNSNMGQALKATLVALTADAVSKKRLATLTKEPADVEAFAASQTAIKVAEDMVIKHEEQQAKVDAGSRT